MESVYEDTEHVQRGYLQHQTFCYVTFVGDWKRLGEIGRDRRE